MLCERDDRDGGVCFGLVLNGRCVAPERHTDHIEIDESEFCQHGRECRLPACMQALIERLFRNG